MSTVQEELARHAADPSVGGPPGGEKFPTGAKGLKDMEEMMKARPIPGQSLTQDPKNKMPYETPPTYTDLQDWLDESFLIISDPEKLPTLLDAMRNEVPVEYLAEKYLKAAFGAGMINIDLLLLSIEPIIYTLLSMGAYANINVKIYPEDPMIDKEKDPSVSTTSQLKKATKGMLRVQEGEPTEGAIMKDGITSLDSVNAPATIPKSLLARSKKAVKAVEGTNGNGEV